MSGRPLVSVLPWIYNLVRGYCMERRKIKEITTIVEKHWAKYPKADNTIFHLDILQRYRLTDADWEEVMKEYNRRTDQIKKKFWFSKHIIDPFLTFLSYAIMVYTSIFVLVSLFNVFSLPSQILFPNGTYSEREQLVNIVNIVIVGLGFFLMYVAADRKTAN